MPVRLGPMSEKIAEGAVSHYTSLARLGKNKIRRQSRIECQRVEDNAFHLY
jgi:hypothetical protein